MVEFKQRVGEVGAEFAGDEAKFVVDLDVELEAIAAAGGLGHWAALPGIRVIVM